MSIITLKDWITSSGRYPERANSPELTESIKSSAQSLIDKVNALLSEIGYTDKVEISSGFRPSSVNASTPGAAKKSAHMRGDAIDILQPLSNNKLGLLIRKIQNNKGKSGILGRHGLMMESLEATKGRNTSWVHLDCVPRSDRPSMEFKP